MTAQTVTRLYDKTGRERRRVRRCSKDRAVLVERDGVLSCPECHHEVELGEVAR